MKVCPNCFNDIELKSFVSTNSNEKAICDYCKGTETDIIDLGDLLDFFTEFFNIFKCDDSGEPLDYLINKDWRIFSNFDASNCVNGIITNILLAIKSDISNYNTLVVYKDEILDSLKFWEKLKEKLKWESRFLTDLQELKENRWEFYFSQNKVELKNTDSLYRARIHQDNQVDKFQLDEMGHPPDNVKVSDGRANPAGIPYLYLSKSKKTTLYETRVSYLDDVSIGEFKVKDGEIISIVDFTAIQSAFAYTFTNYNNIDDFVKSVFLKKKISDELSKPLRRYDSILEYIPTQFICEYIRHITGADGILFASSLHKGGENVVLFNQNKVECVDVSVVKVNDVEIKAK